MRQPSRAASMMATTLAVLGVAALTRVRQVDDRCDPSIRIWRIIYIGA